MIITHPHTLPPLARTPGELALHLAHIAHQLADVLTPLCSNSGTLQDVNNPHNETADMVAQSIIYGLFAAHLCDYTEHNGSVCSMKKNNTDCAGVLQTSTDQLHTLTKTVTKLALSLFPPDHPLSDVLHTVLDNEHVRQIMHACAYLLTQTDTTTLLADFGKATCRHDPILHFYETFLAAYNPTQREQRGVYSTPQPVVSYIVRLVDDLLRVSFQRPYGVADEYVTLVDPAMGTAPFLATIIEHIAATLHAHGVAHTWPAYVSQKLLPRLRGYEILMAPYTIASLKLHLLLEQSGYRAAPGERLPISLANTLADHTHAGDIAPFCCGDDHLMVVIGNPPYARTSANKGQWEQQIRERYYPRDATREYNPKPLLDDYVKFICAGHTWIEQYGRGVLAFVTNHAYLDNPTFRRMRHSLLHSFSDIYIINLHGNIRQRETAPDGSRDENVFAIQQGVAISIFVRTGEQPGMARVQYADAVGTQTHQGGRVAKYTWLDTHDLATTPWRTLSPQSPLYLLVPHDTTLLAEYEQGYSITDIFPTRSTGIKTHRDQFAFDFDRERLAARIAHFRDLSLPDSVIRRSYSLPDTRDWRLAQRRHSLSRVDDWQRYLASCLYRPFDMRSIYAHPDVIELPRQKVMRHMHAGSNIGLLTVRQVAEATFSHVLVTDTIVECRTLISNRGAAFLFPLYCYASPDDERTENTPPKHANLNPAFVRELEQRMGLTYIASGTGDLQQTIGPEDIFHYVYALLYSLAYRQRYSELLRRDFPHIPLLRDRVLIAALVEKGATLVDLHLLRLPGSGGVGGAGGSILLQIPSHQGVSLSGHGTCLVEGIRYIPPTAKQCGQVAINRHQSFQCIAPETWALQIGGYQPLAKWLKDRRGRRLTPDDCQHYLRMVVALCETHRLMHAIDALLAPWPTD